MKTKSFPVAVTIVFSSPLAFADVEELDLYAWQTNQPLPRAWSANLLKKGSDTGDWKGGCFHAFDGNNPCTNIKIGSSTSPGGLYVIVTNDVRGSLRALAIHGTSDRKASLLLPIALDAEERIERLSVDYRAWALGGTAVSELNFSYRPLDDILNLMGELSAGWMGVEGTVWRKGDSNSVRSVGIPVSDLRGRRYVCLRWWVPNLAYSPLMGISDVQVTAGLRPRGCAILIR